MNKELLKKLDDIDIFFKKNKLDKKLNAKEEILFTLLQLLDIRDDDIVSNALFNRMLQKIGMEMVSSEKLFEEYTVRIGLFIEAFMAKFSDKSAHDKDIHKLLLELGAILSKSLDSNEIEKLVDEMISKMEMLSKNEALMESNEIAMIVTEFMQSYFKENLLSRGKDEIVSVLLGVTTSLISLIAVVQMENLMTDFENEEGLSLEEEINRAFNKPQNSDEKIYERRELAYALGKNPICNICDKDYAPRGIKRHLKSCIKKHYGTGDERLIYLVIKGDDPDYYLHISIKASACLSDLDAYLRDVWLECCGHMSEFFVGRNPIDMSMSIGDIFPKIGKMEYIYDFGSSTYLYIEFVDEFKGSQSTRIRTLTRNPMPKLKCGSCGSVKVVAVCSSCLGDKRANLCKKCLPKHECGLDMVLPYVNSPRYGECGYGDWNNTHNFSEEEFDEMYEKVEQEELTD